MKTKKNLTRSLTAFIALIAIITLQQIKAGDYQTFYLDSISNNETIFYCPGNDSLRFIPQKDAVIGTWMINDRMDSIIIDTLIIENGYEGLICCWGSGIATNEFSVYPLKIDAGKDKTIVCGGKAEFSDVTTNYSGTDILTYSWTPATGLNDPDIQNPESEIISDITYTLSVSMTDGCIVKDSVKVSVLPLEIYTEDVNISCGESAQLNVTSNYTGSGTLIYHWDPADNLSAVDISNPVADVLMPAVYTVEITTPNGCTASGDIAVNLSAVGIQPSICMVTVGYNNRNIVVCQKPVSGSIDSFFIYREFVYHTGTYELIGKIPYSAQSVFIDTASNARVQSNRYKTAIKDVCGYLTDQSPEHKTIHLTINKGQGDSWNLIWNEYLGFPVSSYRIYRGDTQNSLTLIGSTAGGSTSYTDFSAPSGDVFYQIEVIPPYSCDYQKKSSFLSSRSNIASNTFTGTSGLKGNSGDFSIYPIPVKDELYFNFRDFTNPEVFILSVNGRVIMNYKSSSSENKIAVNTLPAGLYILKITGDRHSFVTKFVKE